MSENITSSSAEVVEQGDSLTSSALARRHMLLKGLGKGAAVVAAAVPIQSLAVTTLVKPMDGGKFQICSISGMQSGSHSRPPTTLQCGGHSPGWWGQNSNQKAARWPASLPGGLTPDTPIANLFGKTIKTTPNPTLWNVATDPAYSNSDERHWLCAWLNACTMSNFPYNSDEVLTIYQGLTLNTIPYTQALDFFKSLEGVNAV